MTNFKYFAKDASGGFVQGTVAARDQREVIGKLRDKSLTVLEIRETTEGPSAAKQFFSLRSPSKRVKKKELVIMTRQLSTMISAGIPLLEALEILVGQAESP